MRTITTEKTVYTFAELEGSARDTAMQWFIQGIETDQYADSAIDDFETVAAMLGITLAQRSVQLMNGSYRSAPRVYWSGFWSQGDGASFEGSYSYTKGAAKAVRDYAPLDKELHRIADALEAAQKPFFYMLVADITTTGSYSHSGSMRFNVEHKADSGRDVRSAEDDIESALRDLADWLYGQLENEYNYQTSETVIAESMEANGYEFDAQGHIA